MKRSGMVLAGALATVVWAGLTPVIDRSDEVAREFLKQADLVLQEDPVDGNFGIRRLPTLHGRQYFDNRKASEAKTAAAIGELAKEHAVALAAFGWFKNGKFERFTTMSGIWTLNHSTNIPKQDHATTVKYLDAGSNFAQTVAPELAVKVFSKPPKGGVAVTAMQYVDKKAKVYARLICASKPACLKCHTDVKKVGDPLGVLTLIAVPKSTKP
jgi:hypothetical protein